MKLIGVALVACAAVMIQGGFAGAHATNANGHCAGMTATNYIMSDVHDTTHSSQWHNITDGLLSFTMGSPGCAIVIFKGMANTDTNPDSINALHVRTLLDHGTIGGDGLCAPALQDDTFAAWPSRGGSGAVTANSIIRVCKNLTAGAHTIQVQYRLDASAYAHTATIYGHVLTVTHP